VIPFLALALAFAACWSEPAYLTCEPYFDRGDVVHAQVIAAIRAELAAIEPAARRLAAFTAEIEERPTKAKRKR
jgi:hypothetical protein